MGCSPWGRKRVAHDLATKQQPSKRGLPGSSGTEAAGPVWSVSVLGFDLGILAPGHTGWRMGTD